MMLCEGVAQRKGVIAFALLAWVFLSGCNNDQPVNGEQSKVEVVAREFFESSDPPIRITSGRKIEIKEELDYWAVLLKERADPYDRGYHLKIDKKTLKVVSAEVTM